MPKTYEPIATTTLGSAQTNVDFTSIPATYTDLIIVTNHGYTTTSEVRIRVGNGSIDTGSNYSFTFIQGNGTSAASSRGSSTTYAYGIYGTSTNDGNNMIAHFMNYANTTTNKTIISRGNALGDATNASVGLWRSTSAINQIRLYTSVDTFKSGSTFTLYGIKAA